MPTTIEVPAAWGWQEIKAYLKFSNTKCGRDKALALLRTCPDSRLLNYKGERFVFANDFIRWLGSRKDFRDVS